ncbi:MAG TPA: amidohydrolase [Gammaproteobacteria bacterium]|nr:amidohydrolase [Gammaproteobacteria bacterium]|tara:strand:- start:128 stop:1903 length:1776 start_codon:yes stop_codon:yes gene_type:complete
MSASSKNISIKLLSPELKHYFSFFVVLGLLSCSESDQPVSISTTQDAELLMLNGKVYTVNHEQSWAEAIAITDGRIIWVGNSEDANQWQGEGTRTIDLGGKMVLPGFQDIHIHPVHSGVSYQQCALFDAEGVELLQQRIKQCAESEPGEWIRGGGWLVTNFAPSGLPDKKLLDEIVPDRPVALKSSDGHSMWVNSLALELAGINADTQDPAGGRIDRYPNSTEPSGSLQETSAMNLVHIVEPELTQKELEAGLAYSRDHLHSLGITAVQDALLKLTPGDAYFGLPAYLALEERGELNLHVINAMYWQNDISLEEQLPAFLKARDESTPYIHNTAIKIWQDGVIETETAALLEPYLNRGDQFVGELLNEPAVLNEAVTALDAAGFQIHFHAIGDRAIRSAFDSIQAAREANGKHDNRHHISHIQLFSPEDIPRFAELDVVANFQPLWAIEDGYITDLTIPRIGEERGKFLYPIGSVQRTGARVAFGSDWYVTSANPLDGIEAAVTRLDPDGKTDEPLGENEEINLAQAIENYTLNSAYVNFLDVDTGSIEIGKLADIIVLDRNLFDVPASEINQVRVIATLFRGELVFGNLD